ncbi:MAG: hypothetical protein ACFCAD_19610 [Pleurocapsa sp.]
MNHLLRREKAAYQDIDLALRKYEEQNDLASYQKVLSLKKSIIQSQVNQVG